MGNFLASKKCQVGFKTSRKKKQNFKKEKIKKERKKEKKRERISIWELIVSTLFYLHVQVLSLIPVVVQILNQRASSDPSN